MTTDRVVTGFGADSTAADVIDGIDLHGRRAIVTGASSGIGIETARTLARAGAEVTLAVRNLDAGSTVAKEIAGETGNDAVHVARLELSDLSSVAAFVADWDGPLHLLVNNAGIMSSPLTRTPQGWEMQFATNHLGHFALAIGLHDALAAGEGARVVSLSSRGHQRCPVDFDDIHFDRRSYDADLAYGQSKTANVLFAVGATKQWADDGITVNAVHPGAILTNLTRHFDPAKLAEAVERFASTFKTVEQGAATTVLAATSPLLDGIGGRYFEDCNEALPHTDGMHDGVMAWALDPESADRLWGISVAAVGSAG